MKVGEREEEEEEEEVFRRENFCNKMKGNSATIFLLLLPAAELAGQGVMHLCFCFFKQVPNLER